MASPGLFFVPPSGVQATQSEDEDSTTLDLQNRVSNLSMSPQYQEDRIYKHKRERKLLQKSSRVHRRRPRSTSPRIQMKTMKNVKISMELLLTFSLLYQCYIFIKDQQPVRKDQLRVQYIMMKILSTATSTVHRVRTLEEQYSIQISTF